MLTSLRIKNFAIIEELELQFGSGFTVLTGETGAGKSIIIDAISLILGQNASEDLIRTGANESIVEGVFYLQTIPEELAPFMEAGDPLILFRKLSRHKENTARINQQTVTLKTMKKVTASLANIIGQHEHMSLLTAESQRGLLDTMAQTAPKKQYEDSYKSYKECLQKIDKQKNQQEDLSQKIEFLQFQLKDLETPQFRLEEETELETQRNTLKNIAKHKDSLEGLSQTIDEMLQLQKTALKYTDVLGHNHPLTLALRPFLETASLECEDQHRLIQSEKNAATALEELDIEAIEARLDIIFKYKTKYKMPSLEALIDYQNKLKQQLNDLENNSIQQEELEERLHAFKKETQEWAQQWHNIRVQDAKNLSAQVEEKMKALHFSFPKFAIEVELNLEQLNEYGADTVSFLISTNPGEPLKPLAKVASGGELSRLMLAIKTVFFQYSPVPTLIFDEIDVGVGGMAATKIGDYIKLIAQNTQVFCITHLPQIAASADHHVVVSKSLTEYSTHTHIMHLTPSEKAQELKRMVGGDAIMNSLSMKEEMPLFD